jgi:hypothetical protein
MQSQKLNICLCIVFSFLACFYTCIAQHENAWGSIIIVFQNSDTIYIGADSKARLGITEYPFPVCKIHIANNIVFAHSGIFAIGKEFNYPAVVKSLIDSSSTIDSILPRIVKKTSQILKLKLEGIRQTDPDIFNEQYKDKSILNSVIIGQFKKNKIGYVVVQFTVKINSDSTIYIDKIILKCPGDCLPKRPLVMGEFTEVVNSVIFDHDPFLGIQTDSTIINAIDTLIKLQAKSTPDVVGVPVCIIRYTKNSTQWINKCDCRNLD